MSKPDDRAVVEPANDTLRAFRGVSPAFAASILLLILIFAWPLYDLARFSLGHELYSHIVLIPLISAYLVWHGRKSLPKSVDSAPNRSLALILLGIGMAFAAGYAFARLSGKALEREDSLALTTISILCIFSGICAWFIGRRLFRALLFPLVFLIFMVPIPLQALNQIETFLQHGSAAVAQFFFFLSGTTVFAEDLIFQLPGIVLRVAPECSGIHSSLALLITSVLAGYFFLRSPTHCWVLALAVIPLALLRNGFRVFVVGKLCVHYGPQMINSYIHRQGGPIFFVLSLVPFFMLLVWLTRRERTQETRRQALGRTN